MNLDEQLLGAGAATWAQRLAIARLYDLGKFFFTAGTATLAFLFTAERLSPLGDWEWRLKWGFGLLVVAIVVSVVMVIAAAPHLKDKTLDAVGDWTTRSVVLWFLLWAGGTALGVWAVLPS